jgi:hypothetical protein
MKLTYHKSADSLNQKQDLIHLAILLVIAFGIGVYLIATTVAPYMTARGQFLPLVIFTIFYVPIGLEISTCRFAERFFPGRDGLRQKSRQPSGKDRRQWFFILLITGIIICLPKLLRSPGSDKSGFRAAAAWLKQNTAQDALIATPDMRITFYAERKAIFYENTPPGKADYLVSIVENEDQKPDSAGAGQKLYSVWINKQKKKKIVIYKMPL